MVAVQVLVQRQVEVDHLVHVHLVEVTLFGGQQAEGHVADGQRAVLRLLHQLSHALAALQLLAGGFVQVRGKLGKCCQLAVLGQGQADTAAQLLDDLGLGRTTHTTDRETSINGRADAAVEQVGFQVDLAVGDRDHVGGHEGRHVTCLGFDDRQRGQRAGLALDLAVGELLDIVGVHAGGTLQQAAVQVEHVARVGFAARRALEQQRDLAVGHGLLGQIVVHDQGIFALVAEVLAHGAAGVRRNVLQGWADGGRGGDHDGVVHGAVLFQLGHHGGNRTGFLPDGHVNAFDACALLVDDRVDRHGGLAGLTVADDQLALAAADRHHGVNGLQTGLHRLVHRLALDHARRHLLDGAGAFALDVALAVDGAAQGIDHAAQQALAHRHFQNAAGGLHRVAFLQAGVVAQHHGTHGVLLQVQGQAEQVTGELQHFAQHGVFQAMDAHNAVSQGHDGALVAGLGGSLEVLDAILDQVADFGRIQLHETIPK